MNYDLIGIGNALVDIEVQVEDAFVEEISVTKGGMTLSSVEDQKRILDSLQSKPKKISSGGSAANTVHGASLLGAKSYYLGRVANDAHGKHYTEDMRNCGVGFCGPGSDEHGTGTCVILITPDTERTMLTNLGVSSSLHPENVDETIVKSAGAVYVEGYLWTGDETREAGVHMAQLAKKEGIPVSLTLSDAFVVNTYKESLLDFIQWNVDILFCNEVEAKAMTGEEDSLEAFKKLQAMVDTVFLTLGSKGSLAGQSGQEPVQVNTFPVKAVDTTGAGDLFAAGALFGVLKNFSLEESAVIGSYCAAQVVSHMGGRLPVHSHTDAKKILSEYKKLYSNGGQ
ncbi:MAG: adenosine kinase [Nitrospinae bacterium]|nr:adenosine kinase [Nitrospinota bacterium]MZH05034.1 adenosine kinase [Nitrospinota bacterium]MZH14636.1 adenosine kinase [Nitrospinota bacterium]